jgi:cation:H+ antiporter
VLGGIGIFFGADYTVLALTHIAEHFTISPAIVSLTLLSLGTTLPELAVNFTVIKEGKPEMAVGNILGSCIFNTLAIPGIVTMIGSVHVPDELLSFSLPVFVGSVLLFYLVTQDKKISRWEGFIFLAMYLLFIGKMTGLV